MESMGRVYMKDFFYVGLAMGVSGGIILFRQWTWENSGHSGLHRALAGDRDGTNGKFQPKRNKQASKYACIYFTLFFTWV